MVYEDVEEILTGTMVAGRTMQEELMKQLLSLPPAVHVIAFPAAIHEPHVLMDVSCPSRNVWYNPIGIPRTEYILSGNCESKITS